MTKNVTIFSTLSASVACAIYVKKVDPNHPNKIEKKIVINGGANVASKHLLTPKGVVTIVSEEDYKILKDHVSFKSYLERGFVTVDVENKKTVDRAVKDMEKKDKSAPKTEKDVPKDSVMSK